MMKYLHLSAGMAGLVAIVAAAALFMGQDATAQQSYFNVCTNLSLDSTAPNTAATITGTLGIGLDAGCSPFSTAGNALQYNTGGIINFTPPEWKVAKDADIPDGTQVGSFGSRAVLGFFENACSSILTVPFAIYDGTTDKSKPIDALAPGQPDRLSPMRDGDGDGIPDSALKWPSYLNGVATKAGMDLSQLIARFVGVNTASVTGTTVVLNFLVFNPGAKVSKLITLDPRLGYPAVTILQDPSAIASNQDPVSDFCAPLWTQAILNGMAGAATFRANPGDGTYNFVSYVASAPDEDQDGIENSLDPCPVTPNGSVGPAWDPRAPKKQPGDQDGDGLPDDCDPFPTVRSQGQSGGGLAYTDEDLDKWANRSDNCPLVKNEDQADADSDGLGDACDPHLDVRSPSTAACYVTTVTIGAGGAAPADPQSMLPCDPNAHLQTTVTNTPAPTPTVNPSTGVRPTNAPTSGGTGVSGGPDGGIGSLAPSGTSIPAWAGMLAAFGALGLFFGFGVMGTRIWRRR